MTDSIISLRAASPQPLTPAPASVIAPMPAPVPGRVAFGIAEADAVLVGGLRRDALHEAYADTRDDATGAMALALLVAWLNYAQGGPNLRSIIWARELRSSGMPYGPGLAEMGIAPESLTLLMLPDSRAVLRAALDSVRQGAAGAVLIELRGRQPLLDLTATRRLALAAQETHTMVWLVRGDAQPVPSAAQTRWRVAQAPATNLGPAFDLTLLRHRGGPDGLHIRMEWNRDTATFAKAFSPQSFDAALSGLVPAMAAGRTGDTRRGHTSWGSAA